MEWTIFSILFIEDLYYVFFVHEKRKYHSLYLGLRFNDYGLRFNVNGLMSLVFKDWGRVGVLYYFGNME